MKRTNRLDWTISQKGLWTATHEPSGEVLVARTKALLMSRINERELAR